MNANDIRGNTIRVLALNTAVGVKSVIVSVGRLKADREGMIEVVMPMLVEGEGDRFSMMPFNPGGSGVLGRAGIKKHFIIGVSDPNPELASMFMDVLGAVMSGRNVGEHVGTA